MKKMRIFKSIFDHAICNFMQYFRFFLSFTSLFEKVADFTAVAEFTA